METDIQKLKEFIMEASHATYASGDASMKEKSADGSTTIKYEKDSYLFHDNYFGGEPYGGREVVFLNGKPIWMMVYYGFVHPEVSAGEMYSFLMESLSLSTQEMPYRGPTLHERNNLKYENMFSGEAENFHGTEKIYIDGECAYEAGYMGGLVDLKP